MKQNEKTYILQFINRQSKAVFEGVIEDYIRANYSFKASNVARTCRTLRADELIHKIPAPHPENGREVNTYIITEKGRQYLLNQMSDEGRDFMNQWPSQNRIEINPQIALWK